MKSLVLILIITAFTQYSMVHENNDLYIKALFLHIDELPSAKPDTIIVQKDDYLPDNLPYTIKKHTIKYISEKEVDNYEGNKISLKKILPIQVENDMIIIRIADFSYTPKSKLWVGFGGSYYKFKYNCDEKVFKFFEKVNYGI